MIRLFRSVIKAARGDHRARRALVWECVALQHQLAMLRCSGTRRPRFRPVDRLFWVFVSWWWLVWRDGLKIIQPETVLRWRRHGIALICKYRSRGGWRGGRPRIALETRQLIRDMARTNFLWGAPRIHDELLKLGITVSQATGSRYMPPSRKDRRSQEWRTFIRNQAIAIVQSRRLNGHDWARDLLSQVRSRSRVFTLRLWR
jgi:putative transposase